MGFLERLAQWPVLRQIATGDLTALGETSSSPRTKTLTARTEKADRVVSTICPYCAVGCGQLAYVKEGRLTDLEGDPASPISRGRLCPKGAATFQLVTGAHRMHHVLYRKPYATEYEVIPLGQAMDMVAERVKKARDDGRKAVLLRVKQGETVRFVAVQLKASG